MFKKTIVTILAATVVLSGVMVPPTMAAPGKDLRIIPVIVNGLKVKFPDTEPYINTDGRTMVPVRFVSEKLGADVKWEVPTQTAIIKYEGKEIRMSIGSKDVSVDGASMTLDTAAEFTDGRTMVPLRFVSEVLNSAVEWDNGAHAVKVTDAAYQAKVDAGTVTLDPWGREYSKSADDNWKKLTDLESTGMYTMFGEWKPNSRNYVEESRDWNYKKYADEWADHIRNYYEVQLNVDYRTITVDKLLKAYVDNSSGAIHMNPYRVEVAKELFTKYVTWVKENKVIVKGYADPEMSAVYQIDGKVMVTIPIHYKFMIISANDTAQTFMDNWEVSNLSDSYKLKKGVWYDGYSTLDMTTNHAFAQYEGYGLRSTESMFRKSGHFYNTTK